MHYPPVPNPVGGTVGSGRSFSAAEMAKAIDAAEQFDCLAWAAGIVRPKLLASLRQLNTDTVLVFNDWQSIPVHSVILTMDPLGSQPLVRSEDRSVVS